MEKHVFIGFDEKHEKNIRKKHRSSIFYIKRSTNSTVGPSRPINHQMLLLVHRC